MKQRFVNNLNMLIQFSAAPDITSYPKEELVVNTPKQSIVLPCKAEGYPKPMIFWVKNDARVQLNNNLLLTHDGSLVILNMQFENEGIYTCVAANTFGKKIVTVKLYLAQGLWLILLSLPIILIAQLLLGHLKFQLGLSLSTDGKIECSHIVLSAEGGGGYEKSLKTLTS